MPADDADKRDRMGNVAARRDIRRAEAARILGLLDSGELPDRARGWLLDGADSVNVRALATAPGGEPGEGIRLALLGEIAQELRLGFSSLQAARTFQAEEIIRARHFGADIGQQLYGLSNGYTDELVRNLRGFVARMIHGQHRGVSPTNYPWLDDERNFPQ
jgi:hypothetical protein